MAGNGQGGRANNADGSVLITGGNAMELHAEEAVIYVATQQAEDVLDMWEPESTPADSPELNNCRDHLLPLPTDSTSDDDERQQYGGGGCI